MQQASPACTAAATSLAAVPQEIMHSIFNFIDRHSVTAAVLVSRKWHSILVTHPAATLRSVLLTMRNNPYVTGFPNPNTPAPQHDWQRNKNSRDKLNGEKNHVLSRIDKCMIENENASILQTLTSLFNTYYMPFIFDNQDKLPFEEFLAGKIAKTAEQQTNKWQDSDTLLLKQLFTAKHKLKDVEFFPVIYMTFDGAPKNSRANLGPYGRTWQEGCISHLELVLPCFFENSTVNDSLFIGFMTYSLCSCEKNYKYRHYQSSDALFYVYHEKSKTKFIFDDNIDDLEDELIKCIEFIAGTVMGISMDKLSQHMSGIVNDMVARMIYYSLFHVLSIEDVNSYQYAIQTFSNIYNCDSVPSHNNNIPTSTEERRIGYDEEADYYAMSIGNKPNIAKAPKYLTSDVFGSLLHIHYE